MTDEGGTIADKTRPLQVRLTVADLDRSLKFYRDLLQMEAKVDEETGTARLAATSGSESLIVLQEQPSIGAASSSHSGLYHYAILLPDRSSLAAVVTQLVHARWSFDGFSDHGVSEAVYLPDPDGHGIELYRDRPREQWDHSGGEIQMPTEPLDLDDLLSEAPEGDGWEGFPAGTTLGHIHLHVPNLDQAVAFYREAVGFQLTHRYRGQALFFAAGGYHHHLGANIWAGRGTSPAPGDKARLTGYTFGVPSTEEAERIYERLQAAGHQPEGGGGVSCRDPAGVEAKFVARR